jgi:transposase
MEKPGKTVKRKRPRRTFTPEFKAEAVRLCRVGDRSIAQVAKDLDLTETALHEWVHRADVDAGKGPAGALTSDERAELARLRHEIKQLQMECDISKKGGAASTGHRNTLIDHKRRRLEAERLPRATIQPARDPVQVRLRVHRQVRPLREVLPQQQVGVLVRPPLPRALRVAEVHPHVRRHREVLVRRHLEPAVPRQRPLQLPRQRRTASALKAGVNVRRGRFFLTVFPGLSMEHSWRAFSPNWVSTKSRQAQRAECLNAHVFESLEDVEEILTSWRSDYNAVRPHSALGMLTPKEFAELGQRNAGR